MKYEGLVYFICSVLLIIGIFFKLHTTYAQILIYTALAVAVGFQTWLVSRLKKRIKELERSSRPTTLSRRTTLTCASSFPSVLR